MDNVATWNTDSGANDNPTAQSLPSILRSQNLFYYLKCHNFTQIQRPWSGELTLIKSSPSDGLHWEALRWMDYYYLTIHRTRWGSSVVRGYTTKEMFSCYIQEIQITATSMLSNINYNSTSMLGKGIEHVKVIHRFKRFL